MVNHGANITTTVGEAAAGAGWSSAGEMLPGHAVVTADAGGASAGDSGHDDDHAAASVAFEANRAGAGSSSSSSSSMSPHPTGVTEASAINSASCAASNSKARSRNTISGSIVYAAVGLYLQQPTEYKDLKEVLYNWAVIKEKSLSRGSPPPTASPQAADVIVACMAHGATPGALELAKHVLKTMVRNNIKAAGNVERASKSDPFGRTRAIDHIGDYPLIDHREWTKALTAYGAELGSARESAPTPLYHAIQSGCPAAVTALLEAGADPGDYVGAVPPGNDIEPMVLIAVQAGRVDVLEALLQGTFNAFTHTASAQTGSAAASASASSAAVAAQARASVLRLIHMWSAKGMFQPMQRACEQKPIEVLLQASATAATSSSASGPAADGGNGSMLSLLLSWGAD